MLQQHFQLLLVNGWVGTTNLGHITGTAAALFQMLCCKVVLLIMVPQNKFVYGGLSTAKRYNLVFVGSQNEGMIATTEYYKWLSQKSVLNATYNTQKSANLEWSYS